jgi:hypothetical protein
MSSDVFSNCAARRDGSAEYIGIRQPVALDNTRPAMVANNNLRIARFLPDARAAIPCGEVAAYMFGNFSSDWRHSAIRGTPNKSAT